MKASADVRIGIALGALVLLALLFSLGRTVEDPQEPEGAPIRSTYRSRPSGLRALYLTLEQLGYRPRRFHSSAVELKEDGALVIAQPTTPPTAREWEALARWAARGNLLLLYSDEGLPFWTSSIGATRGPAGPVGAVPVQPVPVADGVPSPVVQSPHRVSVDEWHPPESPPGLVTPITGEKSRQRPDNQAFRATPVVVLFAEGGRPVISYARWGRGVIIFSCSPWSLSNEGIARGNNLALFLNLIDVYGAGKRRPIFFDEYHLGGGEGRGPMSLLPPVARTGVWQIVVGLLLLVLAVSRRFGAMIPDTALQRRTRAEYLAAMTSLFRRARALELTAGKLKDETQRDLARALGLPPDARPEAIARAAHEKRGLDADRVHRTLEEADLLSVARARQLPIDEARVLATAVKLHDLREEVARGRKE